MSKRKNEWHSNFSLKMSTWLSSHSTLHQICYSPQLMDENISVTLDLSVRPLNPLKPNDLYMSHTAPLTSKRCILYIYSTNIGTEYFKHVLYSPLFFSSKCSLFHNAKFFGSCIIHILHVLKLKKNNSGAKGLKNALKNDLSWIHGSMLQEEA
jgi:hypothetical protein